MRGAHAFALVFQGKNGIIPADAGSTVAKGKEDYDGGDHPRGCGEHVPVLVHVVRLEGSSPRMRGALIISRTDYRALRIIPADAGSTGQCSGADRRMADHPRGCGEHRRCLSIAGILGGSSPRMRGALVQEPQGRRRLRIIPADAGSTLADIGGSADHEDHPRGCGEHIDNAFSRFMAHGSSPRMRGARPIRYGRTL